MISVERRERIRRAYLVEQRSMRAIAKELHCSRDTIKKAIASAEPGQYTMTKPRVAPVLGPFRSRIDELLAESERMPRKQRYTGHRIYEVILGEGYTGSEPSVRRYIAQKRRERRRPAVYLPLEFDPGCDAQADWGEAVVIMAGRRITVQLFVMRLNYSRKLFLQAYPTQKQECLLDGHVRAFRFFGGVPQRISYDNPKTMVERILEGQTRQEQRTFVAFRSHYLFESHFCTPGQGHEKGGVESGVGYGRRNFMVPLPWVDSYAELNELLLARCQADDARTVTGQKRTVGEMWVVEREHLRPLPERDFECCVVRSVTLNRYSQVEFETNRYSVPADQARAKLVLRAYPFQVQILDQAELLACHPRCYGRQQDVLDALHYLPLLAERPGAFDHAKPIRRWREAWPPIYDRLLCHLRHEWPEGRGVREFVRILDLHRRYPAEELEQAIAQALDYGCPHADGVLLCLHQHTLQEPAALSLDLSDRPELLAVASNGPDLARYDRLLARRA